MSNTAKHLIFTGNVQGVGFRFTAHRIANRHQLTGFVRNLYDGTVEMLVQGLSENIDKCIQDIKDSFAGYIREMKINEFPPDQKYKDFRITF
jgi:acylphosphatase